MTRNKQLDLWVDEYLHDFLRTSYRVKQVLFSRETDYQHVDVVDTDAFGRMLFNDNNVMISERDEQVYHEMIAHVPLFVRPDVRRVLVVGGGDGGTVREVLRHPAVEYCRLIEIDAAVVAACREHIPQTAAVLDDPRVEVTFADGVAHVAETADRYDLVLVDSSDPVGPAVALFGDAFYAGVHRVLTDDGIVVTQANSPFFEMPAQRALVETLERRFRRVHIYNYSNMTYPGGLWSFTFATKGDRCPIGDFDAARVERAGFELRYYNAALHRAAFALPQFQLDALGDHLTPFKKSPTGES